VRSLVECLLRIVARGDVGEPRNGPSGSTAWAIVFGSPSPSLTGGRAARQTTCRNDSCNASSRSRVRSSAGEKAMTRVPRFWSSQRFV
jgi:hypothetical protein